MLKHHMLSSSSPYFQGCTPPFSVLLKSISISLAKPTICIFPPKVLSYHIDSVFDRT